MANQITLSLQNAAKEYFDVGISLYFERKKNSLKGFQPVLGNFAIACELLLKAFISEKIFFCLYSNLSKEAQAMILYPESMPSGTTPNKFIGDIRSFKENIIDINQAISYFYQLYPEIKQEYKPHLKLLSSIRNVAVHAAFPKFQKYHLERIAYITCKIFLHAIEKKAFKLFHISNYEDIEKIVSSYDDERVKKVHKAIEQANKKSKSIDFLLSSVLIENEMEMNVEICPVCENDAVCYGYTEEEYEEGSEDEEGLSLWFFKDQFECESCGLMLDDSSELELAGINTVAGSNMDIDEWFAHTRADEFY